MKNSSKLLLTLLAGSILLGCSANSQTALRKSEDKNNIKVKTVSISDMIKANTAEQYHDLGRMYQSKGNVEMATIAYQKALKLDPDYTKSITALASIFAEQEILVLAITLFEKVVALEPSAQHYNNLGYAYYLNKQYEEADRVLKQAILIDPSHYQAIRNNELVALKIKSEQNIAAISDNNGLTANNEIDSSQEIKPDTELPIIEKNSADTSSAPNQLIQKESNVYVLDSPIVYHTNRNINSNEKSNSLLVDNNNSLTVISSGGIQFQQHAPTINKLFYTSSNIVDLNSLNMNPNVFEVMNGNGIKGIAKAVASHLTSLGVKEVTVGDSKKFNQFKTHIQYKTGYRDYAVTLNHNMVNRPFLIRNDNLPSNVSMRLVLGRDLKS